MNELDLETLVLAKGSHPDRSNGLCIMEAVAWLANEPHSDTPECACRVVAAFLRRLNDRMTATELQRLKAYVPRLLNTRASREVEITRAYIAADTAVRVFAPMALDARGFGAHASALRACAPIVDKETAQAARKVARAAANAAAANAAANADAAAANADAAAAAAAAAYAANAAAAAAAAYAATSAAAYAATGDAAAAVGADAANAATADAAADDAAARSRLIDEALACVDRMLAESVAK